MDRRQFLKVGSATVAAAAVCSSVPAEASAAVKAKKEKRPSVWSSEQGDAAPGDLRARFIGTGAADWNGPDERGEHRRLTSILLDGKILIDFTKTDADMLPEGISVEAVFYTHSHGDHYNAADEIRYIGAPVVYVGDSWVDRAAKEFAEAAAGAGCRAPKVVGLGIGEKARVAGIAFTALPGNHSTSYESEQALIYLVEKEDVRLLYATDTGGIMSRAARLAGIDAHDRNGKAITALVMEATMGLGYEEDFRIFAHSSVGLVKQTADILLSTGRLKAPAGQPVYLTHMARTLHGTQAELDARLPMPLRAACDGLEVIFRAQ